MRALAVSVWIFIILVFMGMCGYIHLLWSQYWRYIERQQLISTTVQPHKDMQMFGKDQVIFYSIENILRNGSLLEDPSKIRIKHSALYIKLNKTKDSTLSASATAETIIIHKNNKPRFPNAQTPVMDLGSINYKCHPDHDEDECTTKTREFKANILSEFRRVVMDESNVFKSGVETQNPYNVHFKVPLSVRNKSMDDLICELKQVSLTTLQQTDEPFNQLKVGKLFPKLNIFENQLFETCAIIASSGALLGSNLGEFIDSHELVLRFNHAPTTNYAQDVGSKTTFRIVNSQVMTKPQFNFLSSELYKNVTLLAWDPSNFSATLEEWYNDPDFKLFPVYEKYMKINRRSNFYILNPTSLWKLWEFLQSNSKERLRKNPPSSGFLGLAVLFPHCRVIDVVEYMPSVRVSRRCHYFDREDNAACTFGSWHPLAAEKLSAWMMNSANDHEVFQHGYLRIRPDIDCQNIKISNQAFS